MVRGIANFRKYFRGFEEQYVIIGGTACDLIMENGEKIMKQIEIENANDDILKKIKIVKDGALLKRADLDE